MKRATQPDTVPLLGNNNWFQMTETGFTMPFLRSPKWGLHWFVWKSQREQIKGRLIACYTLSTHLFSHWSIPLNVTKIAVILTYSKMARLSLRDPWFKNKDNTTFRKIINILYSINVDIILYFILLTINVNFFISILHTPILTLFTRKINQKKTYSHAQYQLHHIKMDFPKIFLIQ